MASVGIVLEIFGQDCFQLGMTHALDTTFQIEVHFSDPPSNGAASIPSIKPIA
jgi:hypothetical protein